MGKGIELFLLHTTSVHLLGLKNLCSSSAVAHVNAFFFEDTPKFYS